MQRISLAINLLFIVLVFLFQMLVIPNLMVIYYVGSIAAYTMFFAMETPAYDRLILAMEDVSEEKKKADVSAAQARNANRSKSAFLANMSHEIRTPVDAILSMDEMIIVRTHESKIRGYAISLKEATEHLLAIINDILDYSRIESEMLTLEANEYEVASFLNAICTATYPAAHAKGLTLQVLANPSIPKRLIGDVERLTQIAQNLTGNAVKFTKEGLVSVHVSGESGKEKGEYVLRIRITDTGVGIPEERLPHLFEPFAQINQKSRSDNNGTGLGLAITNRLIKMMGGTLTVASIRLSGSEFTVEIPQKTAGDMLLGNYQAEEVFSKLDRNAAEQSEETGYEGIFKGKRFLIIDDTTVNLTIASGLLKQTGADIDTGKSGEACLLKAARVQYDVILLDHLMPDMDGIRTLHEMRRRIEDGDPFASFKTPVIAMTANIGRNQKKFYLEQGFTDFLGKPLALQSLVEILQKYT